MANVIKHKRGTSDPTASDLVVGEVAIRTDVGKLFTKMDNGSVAEIAGGGSDIIINTLSSSSATGGGSATFNGSAYRFTLSQPPSVSAQQLLVSIAGVIQKPIAGSGQPSEGFSISGNDIILAAAPATGTDFFILTFKSLGVSEPADNSVTSAKIVDGAIVNADINASAAIAVSKLASFVANNADNRLITGSGTANTLNGESSITYDGTKVLNISSSAGGFFQGTDTDGGVGLIEMGNGNVAIQADTGNAIGSSKIHFFVDNTERMQINSSGNLGIGTTGPQNLFHSDGGSGNTFLHLTNSTTGANSGDGSRIGIASSDSGLRIQNQENSYIRFETNGGERLRIDSSGNVGIGMITVGAALDVNGASGDTLRLSNGSAAAQYRIGRNSTDGKLEFYGTQSGDVAYTFGGVDGERMRIDSSGKVGIGTNNPDQKLKIQDSNDLAIHLLKTGSQDTLIRNTGQTEICAATGGASGQRIAFKIGANTGSMPEIARFTPDGLCFGTDTAAANAISDYEEGTWSPAGFCDGGGFSTNHASYTKIGRLVYFSLYIHSINIPNTACQWKITNLPFNILGGNHFPAFSLAYAGGANLPAEIRFIGTGNYIYSHTTAASSATVTNAGMRAYLQGQALIMSGVYQT